MGVDRWVVFLQEAVCNMMIKSTPQNSDCNKGNKEPGGAPSQLLKALHFKMGEKQE